jgi:2-polyprenyl-3-methyl-5-hydroxy-6-metoxy-1,4-benzoquinol methylase
MAVHPKLAHRTCYHRYEVEPGLFTPGQFLDIEPQRCLDDLGVPADLSGLRALDIGAFDGPFTFDLERRGAQVTAIDVQDPDVTVFNAVKELKGSSATFVHGSIYDATPELLGTFDVVLFAGVYYHLKSPMLALQRIRRLLRDNGQLFIEGAAMTDWVARELAALLALPESGVEAIAELLDALPLSYFDTENKLYDNWTNWWYPTTRCLEVMIRDSGFRNVDLALRSNALYSDAHRRLVGRAVAEVGRSNPEQQQYEHKVYTEDFPRLAKLQANSRPSLVTDWVPPGARRWARRLRDSVRHLPAFIRGS